MDPESVLSQEQIEQFRRDGYIVVRGMYSPEEILKEGKVHFRGSLLVSVTEYPSRLRSPEEELKNSIQSG